MTKEDVEREYWRVVDGGDLMLRVEYGNDLDASSHGSGFPTHENSGPESRAYIDSPWNLNAMPLQKGSLLKYISPDGEISGVAAPWVYVVCVCICINVRVCVCMYINVCVCVCVCMCIGHALLVLLLAQRR